MAVVQTSPGIMMGVGSCSFHFSFLTVQVLAADVGGGVLSFREKLNYSFVFF